MKRDFRHPISKPIALATVVTSFLLAVISFGVPRGCGGPENEVTSGAVETKSTTTSALESGDQDDTGDKASSGNSGPVTGRALYYDHDRSTVLTLTSSVVGDFSHAKVKSPAGDWDFTKLTGGPTVALPLTGLAPGHSLQVSGSVRRNDKHGDDNDGQGNHGGGGDGNNSQHGDSGGHVNFNLSATVHKAPRLVVSGVQAPPQTNAGTVIQVSAIVAEENGETGADVDCVLSANGVQVGNSVRISVPAGGNGTCVFNQSFQASGQVNLTVTPGNFVPAADGSTPGQTSLMVIGD